MKNPAHTETARSQLRRLATLTDVVYAGALILIVFWLPRPDESTSGGEISFLALFAEHSENLIAVLIGLLFVILYWLRSNTLLSALDRTDGVHTAFSILSVFFLLLLLYVVATSPEVAPNSRRAGESVAVVDRPGRKRTGCAAGVVDPRPAFPRRRLARPTERNSGGAGSVVGGHGRQSARRPQEDALCV